jgi:2-hydroxy-3-keto-5-methylthiopentenyl-1-phosphate phosphatase
MHPPPLPQTDISAAKYADVLFVKTKADGENDLAAYCHREGIKHIEFGNFSEAVAPVAAIVKGEKTIDDLVRT